MLHNRPSGFMLYFSKIVPEAQYNMLVSLLQSLKGVLSTTHIPDEAAGTMAIAVALNPFDRAFPEIDWLSLLLKPHGLTRITWVPDYLPTVSIEAQKEAALTALTSVQCWEIDATPQWIASERALHPLRQAIKDIHPTKMVELA